MKSVLAIFRLYGEHPLFLILSGLMAALMVIVRILWDQKQFFWLEDIMTLWLVVWMSHAFLLGVMVKRQAVSPVSQLLPGYRRAMAAVASFILLAVIGSTATWFLSMPGWLTPASALTALAWLCVLTYLATAVIAYVSVRILILVAYTMLLFIVSQVLDILKVTVFTPGMIQGLQAGVFVLVGAFIWRVYSLKEGMVEFPYLLSWPLYRSQQGAVGGAGPYKHAVYPSFINQRGLIQRAEHWGLVESGDLLMTAGALVLAAGLFEGYVVFTGATGFYTRPYSNFLLLVMVPTFLTLVLNYRMMAYRDYALMLPVRREEMVRQWGVLLSAHLAAAWGLISVLFVAAPGFLLRLPFVASGNVWAYLLLTGVFSQMLLAWIAFAATLKNPRAVIGHSVAFITLVVLESWSVPYLNVSMLLLHTVLAAAAGVLLGMVAYQRWCREEVIGG